MRLDPRPLTGGVLALLAVLPPRPVGGQDTKGTPPTVAVIGRANVYEDDDHTSVITFLTEASGALRDLTLQAGFLTDVQTSASVDVVSNATPGVEPTRRVGDLPAYFEIRAELAASASYRLDLLTMNGGYIYSIEHDYRSHTMSLGSSIELFERNSTLAAGYSLGFNQSWRGRDPFFAPRDKTRHGMDVSWTQVLGPRTLGTLSYGLALESGFLSSSYRFVTTSDGAFRTREAHPDFRMRHAVSGRLRRYLVRDLAVEGGYRFYGDDWGVYSHTLGATVLWQPVAWLEVDLHDRFYWQTDADFYRPSYVQPEALMSADKELSRFVDNMIGVRLGLLLGPLGPVERLRLDAKFDWLRFEYSNFLLRSQLNAFVSQVGAAVEF
jgi:Protein of unknown function (DUF3570)